LGWVNKQASRASMVALLATACALTWAVLARILFKASNDWQDEVSVFMLSGAVFMSAGWVQAQRGHVAVELLAEYMSPRANAIRQALADLASGVFCAFYSFKSWQLFHEAWRDGATTSSTFGSPLWIPYSLMAAGMSLLALQLLLQAWLGAMGALPAKEKTQGGGHA
jgi:TRAP-type C4-dicarboxylate transport system permease small subunit